MHPLFTFRPCAFALMLLASGTASAQSALATPFGVIAGPGAVTCRQYLKTRSQDADAENQQLEAWVQGFLSGMQAHNDLAGGQPNAAAPSGATLLSRLDDFCKRDPARNLYEGAMAVFTEL